MLSSIFGSAPSPNFGLSNAYMGALGNIGSNLGQQAGQAGQQYGLYNTNDANALNAYSQYLTSDPGTEQGNAGIIANAEKGASEAADFGKAKLQSDLYQRGIPINSSIGAGALANIDQNLATNDANNRIGIGQWRINQRANNLATNANLWDNAASNAFNRDYSLNNQQIGLYNNLYNDATQQALDQYNADQNKQNQQNQLWGSIGNVASMAFGGPPIFGGNKKSGDWSQYAMS